MITIAGEPEAVAEAALRGVGKAAELIDLTRQTGAHPRVGATDVVPFVPIEGMTIEDCVALAKESRTADLGSLSHPCLLLRSGRRAARARQS